MKNVKIIAFLAVALMLTLAAACKKKENVSLSKASFSINGKTWKSEMVAGSGSTDKKIGFAFAKGIHDANAENDATLAFDETITLGLLDKKIGKQNLQSVLIGELGKLTDDDLGYALFSTFSDQGCVGCEIFIVDSTQLDQNWVEITKEEGNYKKVWGKFNLVMVKQMGAAYCESYPDTLRIENGEFYVEL